MGTLIHLTLLVFLLQCCFQPARSVSTGVPALPHCTREPPSSCCYLIRSFLLAWCPGGFHFPDALPGCGERGQGRACVAHSLRVQGDADLQGLPPGPKSEQPPSCSDSVSIYFHPTSGICLGPPSNLRFPLKFFPAPTLIYPRMGAQLGPPSFSLGMAATPGAQLCSHPCPRPLRALPSPSPLLLYIIPL